MEDKEKQMKTKLKGEKKQNKETLSMARSLWSIFKFRCRFDDIY